MSTQLQATQDVFGPIVAPYAIEQAAIAHLQKWLWPTYLEATEMLNGVTVGSVAKPDPAAIYGVYDEEDYIQERMPGVMVSCVTPTGEPEHLASAGIIQQYDLQVWSAVVNDDTQIARRDAGLYAAAVGAAIMQQFAGGYPSLVSNVSQTAAPSLLLPNPDVRTIYLGHVAFAVIVAPIIVPTDGPLQPLLPSETAAEWPIVETETLTVTTEPLAE